MADDYDKVAEKISRDEFERRVQEKIKEFQGLLTREGAVSIIASELGITQAKKPRDVTIKIADIQEGMSNIDMVGKVTRISDVKQFTRKATGDVGRVMNVVLADETGSLRISMWDEQTEMPLAPGDVLRVTGGFAKKGFTGGIELSVTRRGTIEKSEAEVDVPVAKEERCTIADIQEGMSNITIIGVVAGVSDVREYERDGRSFKVCSLFLNDGTGQARVSLWNAHAEATKGMNVGDAIKLSGCYSRMGFSGIEVQTNAYTRIDTAPDTQGLTLPTIDSEVALGDVTAEHQFFNVRGVVVAVFEPRTFQRDDGTSGNVGSLELRDDTGSCRVTLWDEKADMLSTLAPGVSISLEGCSAREGLEGIEISLGRQGRITFCIPDEATCALRPEGLARVLEAKDGAIKALTREGDITIVSDVIDVVPGDLISYKGTVNGQTVEGADVAPSSEQYPSLEDLLEPPVRTLAELSAGTVAMVRGIVRVSSSVRGCNLLRLDDGTEVMTGYAPQEVEPGTEYTARAYAFDSGGAVEFVTRDIAPLDMEREAYRLLACIGEDNIE